MARLWAWSEGSVLIDPLGEPRAGVADADRRAQQPADEASGGGDSPEDRRTPARLSRGISACALPEQGSGLARQTERQGIRVDPLSWRWYCEIRLITGRRRTTGEGSALGYERFHEQETP